MGGPPDDSLPCRGGLRAAGCSRGRVQLVPSGSISILTDRLRLVLLGIISGRLSPLARHEIRVHQIHHVLGDHAAHNGQGKTKRPVQARGHREVL